jgi:hypothetical protein
MERWEEEFDDLFPDIEEGSFGKMARQYFRAGWLSAVQVMQDKIDEGDFGYE